HRCRRADLPPSPAAVCDRLRRPLAGGGFLAAITAGCVRLLSLAFVGVIHILLPSRSPLLPRPPVSSFQSRRSLFTPDNPVEGYHARYA
uniref:Os01g0778700 protein n=1 Tax=Macrostomum lignano TaxID=282301 RepID=A0A1I8FQD9_9PLAT